MNLDKWLAENVMGWHSGRTNNHPSNILLWLNENEKSMLSVESWHPTTDIAQAMMCVEVMRERGLSAHMNNMNNGAVWTVQLNPGYISPWDEGKADTLPLAICRAIHKVPDVFVVDNAIYEARK